MHAMRMSATQCHLLRLQQVIHAQYKHEQALFLKQVLSASDHLFKYYRQNIPGVLYESLCI
jgi:hypothetical protein